MIDEAAAVGAELVVTTETVNGCIALGDVRFSYPEVYEGLKKEIFSEPMIAFVGGEDGLIFYRAFCRLYPALLKPNGLLAFEIGEEQGEAVAAMMQEAGLQNVTVLPDLAGLPRMVLGTK